MPYTIGHDCLNRKNMRDTDMNFNPPPRMLFICPAHQSYAGPARQIYGGQDLSESDSCQARTFAS